MADLVAPEHLRKIEGVLKRLNPKAEILQTRFSRVSVSKVLNTNKFSFEEASMAAGWLQTL